MAATVTEYLVLGTNPVSAYEFEVALKVVAAPPEIGVRVTK
jgi:hypothetical protein